MKKQSKEELEADLKKTQAELEVEPSKPAPEEDEEQKPDPDQETIINKEEEEEPAPSEPAPSEPAPSPDYKKKFSESSREAQKIYAKNRKINQAIDEANEIPEPTDEELEKLYPDYDVMSDIEKSFAKEAVVSKRWREKLAKAREEGQKIEKWNDEVEKYIDNPKTLIDNPELEGKEEEFKMFATEESNNSVPFKILVSAFLHEHSISKPKSKGKMFEQGSGGSNERPKSKADKISLEEAHELMLNDYRKYKEYLLAGRIESDIE